MSERKHLIISVGTSGFRTARTLYRLVNEHGLGDQFKFVSIETAALDDEDVPESLEAVELRRDDAAAQRFEQLKADVPWLDERLELANQGATSKPPIGRFLLEYYHSTVYNSVDQILGEFVDPYETDELSTWLIGALSGGTAAGMFPLLSSMVERIVGSYADQYDIEPRLLAAGTVSKFEHRHQQTTLGPIPSTYVNTNISLQQFTTLLNIPDETGQCPDPYPVTLPMDAAPDSNVLDDEFEITEPPLDALLLLPVDEERMYNASRRGDNEVENFRERVNWTIASAVLSITQTDDGFENITTRTFDNRLMTVSAASVRVPLDEVSTYFEKFDEQEALDQVIDVLEEWEDELEDSVDRVDRLLAHVEETTDEDSTDEDWIASNEIEELSTPVASDLSRIRQTVTSLSLASIAVENLETHANGIVESDTPTAVRLERVRQTIDDLALADADTEDLRTYADRLATRIEGDDDAIPHGTIARLVFYQLVADRIDDELDVHEFVTEVEDFWIDNNETMTDRAPGLDDAGAVEKYEQAIRPALREKRSTIKAKRENTRSIRIGVRRTLKDRLDAVEQRLGVFDHLHDEYTSLVALRETLDEQLLPDVRVTLRNHRDALLTELETLREEELQEFRNNKSDVESELASAKNRLTGDRKNSIRMLPLNTDSMDEISERTLENAGNVHDLIDAGVVDQDDLVEALRQALASHLDEPLEDYMHNSLNNMSQGTLALLTDSDNRNALDLTNSSGQDAEAVMAAQDIDRRLDVKGIDAPFELTLVALYENVYLTNTSELRRIHERWECGTLDELFEDEVPFEQNIAYPQLFVSGATGAPDPDQGTITETRGD